MSTRTNIIIKDSNQPVQRLIYHHCDGYFEGVGCEIKNEILPIYIDNHKSFHVNDLWAEIIDFDEQYMNSECIHGDIEYLYMLEVISDSVLKFKCWSVPCFGTYDYTTNENCTLIYEADIFINGRKKVIVNECQDSDDEYDSSYGDNTIACDEVETVIDESKTTLEHINYRNMLITKIVDANYSSKMTKEEFTQILKDFYDVIILKNKLNII